MKRARVDFGGLGAFTALAILGPGNAATAQPAPTRSERAIVSVDSQFVENTEKKSASVFSTTVRAPGAPWLRLRFKEVLLAGSRQRGNASYLLLTSVRDGAFQILDSVHLTQWRNKSAYFNGDAVTVEIIAFPGTGPNRVAIGDVTAGEPPGDPESICGGTDDRLPSDDPRVGRWIRGDSPIPPCTAFIIDDANHCMLSAGHCAGAVGTVLEFNVPFSDPVTGERRHPPPEDQYAVDDTSMQSFFGAIGDDWAYFGCFPNSNTGLTPYEAQGAFFTLASSPPPVVGQDVRRTGFGTTRNTGAPLEWSLAQKTHVAPYVGFAGTTLHYLTDSTSSDSGSPVMDEQTGELIAIHRGGGCMSAVGANQGVGVNNAGLRIALANPRGVCMPTRFEFAYPTGRPEVVAPAGGTLVDVVILEASGVVPQPGTGMFHYDAGAGLISVPMAQTDPNVYQASFPTASCPTPIRYFFSAEDTAGTTFRDPPGAPQSVYKTLAASRLASSIAARESFEGGLPPDWSATGLWHVTGACPLGLACDGTLFAYYGQDASCNYSTGARTVGSLLSAPIALPIVSAFGRIVLNYCQSLALDSFTDRVEVRVNGEKVDFFPERTNQRRTRAVDITRFTGQTIQAEFFFDSVDATANFNRGWQIDLVEIVASRPVCDRAGDLNCDGAFNGADIDPFFLALGDPAAYTARFPNCDILLGDMNGDGAVNGDDIDPFFACLGGGACP
ncbi:MAG: hypothetical protein IH986_04570 [Planctomycetes bacterium]|nr:hypothetical protein [Planctomycetota bacterium]